MAESSERVNENDNILALAQEILKREEAGQSAELARQTGTVHSKTVEVA